MKTKLLSMVFVLAFAFVSCEDWLEGKSSNEVESKDQFEKESGFQDALTGVYIGMADANLYAKEYTWYFVELIGQQYRNLGEQSKQNIADGKYTDMAVEKDIEKMWNSSYNVIANINNTLKYIDEKQEVLHPINYRLIKGELLGLRAFLHFDLLRLFGYGNWQNRSDLDTRLTIPYVREFTKEHTPQRSYTDTFKLLMADIEAAADYLKEDPVTGKHPKDYYEEVNVDKFWDNRQMRMNYYAVKALQARAYLWEGSDASKAKALDAAKEVIGSDIYQWVDPAAISSAVPSLQDMTFTTEYLFGLYITDFSRIIANNFDVSTAADAYNAFYLTSEMAYYVYDISEDWSDEAEAWVTGGIGLSDCRYNTLLERKGADMNMFVPLKLRQADQYADAYRNRIPLMRISEMYYIVAECYATGATPNLSLAREQLDAVREHRGIVEKLDEGLSAEEVMDEIRKEYAKEFLCEGQMFYYYKRLGIEEILKEEYGSPIKMNDKKYILPYPVEEISVAGRVQ